MQNRCDQFDFALENNEDFKTVRTIYREIKELRAKLIEMKEKNSKTTNERI
ncbi:MAG TPA: hypothetical protein VNW49_16915 [Puia sp.]|nr:hypothetical protein [Puia sp.]